MKIKLLLCILLLVSLVNAGSISLQTQTAVHNDSLYVIVKNVGNEQGYNARLSMEFNNNIQKSNIDTLTLDEKIITIFPLNTSSLKKGSHPIFVTIKYQDLNGYNLSAISHNIFVKNQNPPSNIDIKMDDITISKHKKLHARIINKGHEKNITLTLHLPLEFSSVEKQNIYLERNEVKEIDFDIENNKGLPESKYLAILSAEYEDNFHYTVVETSMMTITKEFEFNPLLIILITLIIIFVYFQIRNYTKGINKDKQDNTK